jgi:hypothetical protein
MSADELIGDIIQVIAHDLNLTPNIQNIVSGPLDQLRFRAGRRTPIVSHVWHATRGNCAA